MRTLYRAFAYIPQSRQSEATVFFEAPSLATASRHLLHLLCGVWAVPSDRIEVYNCWDEQALVDGGFGPERTGDARLFETGSGGTDPIHYADPASTLMLVRPATLARLVAAQQLAQQLLTHWRTNEGKQELIRHWNDKRRAA